MLEKKFLIKKSSYKKKVLIKIKKNSSNNKSPCVCGMWGKRSMPQRVDAPIKIRIFFSSVYYAESQDKTRFKLKHSVWCLTKCINMTSPIVCLS